MIKMDLVIKVDDKILDRIISVNIRELFKLNYLNLPPQIIYQMGIEISILLCFLKIINDLKEKGILNEKLFFKTYFICETLLERKLKAVYLKGLIDLSEAKFLTFAKIIYEKELKNMKKSFNIYI